MMVPRYDRHILYTLQNSEEDSESSGGESGVSIASTSVESSVPGVVTQVGSLSDATITFINSVLNTIGKFSTAIGPHTLSGFMNLTYMLTLPGLAVALPATAMQLKKLRDKKEKLNRKAKITLALLKMLVNISMASTFFWVVFTGALAASGLFTAFALMYGIVNLTISLRKIIRARRGMNLDIYFKRLTQKINKMVLNGSENPDLPELRARHDIMDKYLEVRPEKADWHEDYRRWQESRNNDAKLAAWRAELSIAGRRIEDISAAMELFHNQKQKYVNTYQIYRWVVGICVGSLLIGLAGALMMALGSLPALLILSAVGSAIVLTGGGGISLQIVYNNWEKIKTWWKENEPRRGVAVTTVVSTILLIAALAVISTFTFGAPIAIIGAVAGALAVVGAIGFIAAYIKEKRIQAREAAANALPQNGARPAAVVSDQDADAPASPQPQISHTLVSELTARPSDLAHTDITDETDDMDSAYHFEFSPHGKAVAIQRKPRLFHSADDLFNSKHETMQQDDYTPINRNKND